MCTGTADTPLFAFEFRTTPPVAPPRVTLRRQQRRIVNFDTAASQRREAIQRLRNGETQAEIAPDLRGSRDDDWSSGLRTGIKTPRRVERPSLDTERVVLPMVSRWLTAFQTRPSGRGCTRVDGEAYL